MLMHAIKHSAHLLSDRQVNSQKVNINMNIILGNKDKAMSSFEHSFLSLSAIGVQRKMSNFLQRLIKAVCILTAFSDCH